MAKCLVVVAGSKGGVGKSLMSMVLADFLNNSNADNSESVLVLDGDDPTFNVGKIFPDSNPKAICVDLDKPEGWMDVGDQCSEYEGHHVVVNTGARSMHAMIAYAPGILAAVATELTRPLSILWVVNSQRDSAELLASYMDAIKGENAGRVVVVCNEGEDEARTFPFFEPGKALHARVTGAGGAIIRMPTLARRITQLLYTERRNIHAVATTEAFGTRVEMERWRHRMWTELDQLDLFPGSWSADTAEGAGHG